MSGHCPGWDWLRADATGVRRGEFVMPMQAGNLFVDNIHSVRGYLIKLIEYINNGSFLPEFLEKFVQNSQQ